MFGAAPLATFSFSGNLYEVVFVAAYPTEIGIKYKTSPINSRRVDVSTSGKVSVLDLTNQTAYRIEVEHPLIDSTDVGTLETFYTNNKSLSFTITLAGTTYNAYFETDYNVHSINATFFNASAVLVGNKA